MAKQKTTYVCRNCGADSPKWIGKCPACGEWNSYVEEVVSVGVLRATPLQHQRQQHPQPIQNITHAEKERIDTRNEELNRVLGGGLTPGSLVLIGGEPGIGKSTLILQVALNMAGQRILYASGEESVGQLKLRADRLIVESGKLTVEGGSKGVLHTPEKPSDNSLLSTFNSQLYVVGETSLEQLFVHIQNVKPDVLIVDSIQTIATQSAESSAGSITQVRECTAALLRFAKETDTPVLLVGHINKEGGIAGPKMLEHIVDVVLQFEGDRQHLYRILRGIKNRFGSTAELGIFEMQQSGLRQVSNPSELLFSQNHDGLSGVAIAATMEGMRPFLIEVQALVSSAVYGVPQRSCTGFDLRRLNMLLAVLEKRVGFKLAQKDVFLNIAGGIRVNDPAIDLAVISSIISSNIDTAIQGKICMAGEVGLSGEIRPINRIEQRIGEAQKLGFHKIIIPHFNVKGLDGRKFDIQIVSAQKVEEAVKIMFR